MSDDPGYDPHDLNDYADDPFEEQDYAAVGGDDENTDHLEQAAVEFENMMDRLAQESFEDEQGLTWPEAFVLAATMFEGWEGFTLVAQGMLAGHVMTGETPVGRATIEETKVLLNTLRAMHGVGGFGWEK